MLTLAKDHTFKATVEIPLPGDQVAHVECEFVYMPAAKLAEFLRVAWADSTLAWWEKVVLKVSALTGLRSLRQLVRQRRDDSAYLCDIVRSWSGTDTPFSEDAARQLCVMYPHAFALIVKTWASELARLRLGN